VNEMKRIRYLTAPNTNYGCVFLTIWPPVHGFLLADMLPSDVGVVSDSFTSSVGANGASNTYKLTPI